jgi:hypothetical protein
MTVLVVRKGIVLFMALIASLILVELLLDVGVPVPAHSHLLSKKVMGSDLALAPEAINDLQLCRLPALHFNNVADVENNRTDVGILFGCAGKEYNEFGDKLFSFANNISVHGNYWGRRSDPISRDKSILMFGNSHTRQTAHALVGQHHEKVQSASCELGNNICTFRFDNNVSLYVVTNSPVVHSHNWPDLLEGVVGRPLQSFDAVVLGKFNRWAECSAKFKQVMARDGKVIDKSIDIEHIMPPNISAVAEFYSGPIVALSMYDKKVVKESNKTRATVEKMIGDGRENLVYIDARKYVGELGECGSDDKSGKSARCDEKSPGHRCTGPKGGHPDLIAWDVIESLHKVLA